MTDQYIGIDLHKAFFQACAVSPTGERLWRPLSADTVGVAALTAQCTARTALAVEASTPTWHFAEAVAAHVGTLRIVDPLKTKLKAGYAAKTDRLDARRLADALRPTAWWGSIIRRWRFASCASVVAPVVRSCRSAPGW